MSESPTILVHRLGVDETSMARSFTPFAAELRASGNQGERRLMNERDLLERFVVEKDPEAFRELIERHGAMVLAVCRSILHEPHDAEDAFQNVFLILARRANTIKHLDTIAPWLHRVALRVARRSRATTCQRRAREMTRPDSRTEHPEDSTDPTVLWLLREEISQLPDRYRLPLVLCHLEGKTSEEAAWQLQWPVGTVKGRLSRARQTLRDRLSRRGLDPATDRSPGSARPLAMSAPRA
jgi:RNA polymerase sigma factor (sigma-70 family)